MNAISARRAQLSALYGPSQRTLAVQLQTGIDALSALAGDFDPSAPNAHAIAADIASQAAAVGRLSWRLYEAVGGSRAA